MSTTTFSVAFRCNKCWQLTRADTDQAGSQVPCLFCSTLVVVPEATPELISAGEHFVENSASSTIPKIDLHESLSKKDIDRIVSQKLRARPPSMGSVRDNVCSRWTRLFGAMIDVFVWVIVIVVDGIICMRLEIDPNGPHGYLILICPVLFGVLQACLISFKGRTIGKYCVISRIVTASGRRPGFFRGVVLRVGLGGLLGLIPFFGLADALWIFGHQRRCLHDLIAGTYVIDA